jgi:hypothetical protein
LWVSVVYAAPIRLYLPPLELSGSLQKYESQFLGEIVTMFVGSNRYTTVLGDIDPEAGEGDLVLNIKIIKTRQGFYGELKMARALAGDQVKPIYKIKANSVDEIFRELRVGTSKLLIPKSERTAKKKRKKKKSTPTPPVNDGGVGLAYVIVSSNPPGATIYVNGLKTANKTISKPVDDDLGPYMGSAIPFPSDKEKQRFQVVMEGYKNTKVTYLPYPTGTKHFHFELKPKTGFKPVVTRRSGRGAKLRIRTIPSGGLVYLDDRLVGTSGEVIEFSPGTYNVRVELGGHKPIQKDITFESGVFRKLKVRLRKKKASGKKIEVLSTQEKSDEGSNQIEKPKEGIFDSLLGMGSMGYQKGGITPLAPTGAAVSSGIGQLEFEVGFHHLKRGHKLTIGQNKKTYFVDTIEVMQLHRYFMTYRKRLGEWTVGRVHKFFQGMNYHYNLGLEALLGIGMVKMARADDGSSADSKYVYLGGEMTVSGVLKFGAKYEKTLAVIPRPYTKTGVELAGLSLMVSLGWML